MQTAFRMLGIVPSARNYFAEMKYKPKPRFEAGFLARGGQWGFDSLIGRLFPQPEVRGADRHALLDEFLGNHFALVSLPQTPPSLFERFPADTWHPLQLQRVAILRSGDTTTVPAGVRSVFDVRGVFSRAVKNLPAGLALIRPDRYVAAYLPAQNLSAGVHEVEKMISGTWK